MTAREIAEDFVSTMNPSGWDGVGKNLMILMISSRLHIMWVNIPISMLISITNMTTTNGGTFAKHTTKNLMKDFVVVHGAIP